MLLPHMEFMRHELSIDANISIEEGLVDLAAALEIPIQALDATRGNWDSTLATIMQVHKSILDK